jgi:NADPH:quinone reductase-like Zn-dependent oxidoreductase
MKCIVYGTKESRLQKKTMQTPATNKKGHVLVRVHAAGLNPVDAKDVMGDKLPHTWKRMKGWLHSYISNRIPGFDFAGMVLEDSNGFFSAGDNVYGTMPPFHGTLAEYVSAPLDQICTMPESYSFQQAAALPLVGYVMC